MNREYVVVSEAAQRSGYTRARIHQLVQEGKVSCQRLGPRAFLVDVGAVMRHKAEMDALGTAKYALRHDKEAE